MGRQHNQEDQVPFGIIHYYSGGIIPNIAEMGDRAAERGQAELEERSEHLAFASVRAGGCVHAEASQLQLNRTSSRSHI